MSSTAERIALERYEGHGDLDLTTEERELLCSAGFEPWGNHGWVWFREDGTEQGGTCYDDRWALREAIGFSRDGGQQ